MDRIAVLPDASDQREGAESLPLEARPAAGLGANATWWSGRPTVSPAMALQVVLVAAVLLCLVFAIVWRAMTFQVDVVPDPSTQVRQYVAPAPKPSVVAAAVEAIVPASENYSWRNVDRIGDRLSPYLALSAQSVALERYSADKNPVRALRQVYHIEVLGIGDANVSPTGALVPVAIRRTLSTDTDERALPRVIQVSDVVITLTLKFDRPTEINCWGIFLSDRFELTGDEWSAKDRPIFWDKMAEERRVNKMRRLMLNFGN